MTAWALLAVSSDSQADTLEHQRAWAEETAKAKGWELTRVRGDDQEGVGSGKDGPRQIVQQIVAELRALPAEARPMWLLVTRADRLGRGGDIVDNQIVLRDLKRLGVRVWARLGGEKKMDTAMEQFFNAAEAALAAQENEVKRDKAIATYKRKRAAGLAVGNRRPYGLTIGPDGHDIVIPEQAEAVRMAFQMRIEGHGYKAICDRMIAVAPPQHFRRSRTPSKPIAWSPQAARRLLQTEAYIGTIIDEFTFRRARQIAEQMGHRFPSRARKYPWPLAGALRCVCGYGLVGISAGGGNSRVKKTSRYYCCRKTVNHGGRVLRHRAEPIEQQFVALLQDLGSDPALVAEYRRANLIPTSPALLRRSLKAVNADLAAIDARRKRVWELNETGVVRNEDVQQRLDELGEERTTLLARISDLELQIAIADSAAAHLADAVEEMRLAAQTFVEAEDADQRRIALRVGTKIGGLSVGEDHLLRVARPAALAK